jgi:hypothetical protein
MSSKQDLKINKNHLSVLKINTKNSLINNHGKPDFTFLNLQFPSGHAVSALCDTGCEGDGVITPSLVEFLGLGPKIQTDNTRLEMADGTFSESSGKVEVHLKAGDKVQPLTLTIFPITSTFIIGSSGLDKFCTLNSFKTEINRLNNELEKN